MCVALPSRVVWIGESTWGSIPGRAVIGDAEIEVELMLVPEVAVGDHVIIHSGYAIAVVSEDEAAKTRKLLGSLATDPPIHRSTDPKGHRPLTGHSARPHDDEESRGGGL